jgi:hypothetical protein
VTAQVETNETLESDHVSRINVAQIHGQSSSRRAISNHIQNSAKLAAFKTNKKHCFEKNNSDYTDSKDEQRVRQEHLKCRKEHITARI